MSANTPSAPLLVQAADASKKQLLQTSTESTAAPTSEESNQVPTTHIEPPHFTMPKECNEKRSLSLTENEELPSLTRAANETHAVGVIIVEEEIESMSTVVAAVEAAKAAGARQMYSYTIERIGALATEQVVWKQNLNEMQCF